MDQYYEENKSQKDSCLQVQISGQCQQIKTELNFSKEAEIDW